MLRAAAEIHFTPDALIIGDTCDVCHIDANVLKIVLKKANKVSSISALNLANTAACVELVRYVRDSKHIRGFECEFTYTGILVRNMTDVLHNPALERVRLIACTKDDAINALSLAARHPSLKYLAICRISYSITDREYLMQSAIELLSHNRTLIDYKFDIRVSGGDSRAPELKMALENNWVVLSLNLIVISSQVNHGPVIGDVHHLYGTSRIVIERNRSMQWIVTHESALDVCLGLASLRLSTYAVLEILGWVPPFQHRFRWHGIDDFDPLRRKKVRLIDGVKRAYEACR
jgi:hypothetical protein